jgi:hypothetical protein
MDSKPHSRLLSLTLPILSSMHGLVCRKSQPVAVASVKDEAGKKEERRREKKKKNVSWAWTCRGRREGKKRKGAAG